MHVSNSIIEGQWEGYFTYGSIYGELGGQSVRFRMTLKHLGEGKFAGKCIELDGPGYNENIVHVEGFVEASFISFTKKYSSYHQFDEEGNSQVNRSAPEPLITYIGNYDWHRKIFSGKWEILADDELDKGADLIVIGLGTWQMTKM
jgi:hypothetical protein